MTLTPEQFNKLATKEYLKNLATKIEVKEMFEKIMVSINVILHKLDYIEKISISDLSSRA